MGPYRIEQKIDNGSWIPATSRTYPDGSDLSSVKAKLVAELEAQGMAKQAEAGNAWTMKFKTQTVQYRLVNADGTPA